jgi:hypothetical protein
VWCYIIALFRKDSGRNNVFIPFALVFMTSPVWSEQFYFVFQATETAFALSLCPLSIYLLYKGFLDNERVTLLWGFILLVFIISIYQAVVPLFCCGVFVCFILLQDNSAYDPRVYRRLCLQLFITLVAAMALFTLIGKIIVTFILQVEKSDYLDNMNQWGQVSLQRNFFNILLCGYKITIGGIPAVQVIAEPVMARFARSGMQGAQAISNSASVMGNVLLLPATVVFIVQIASAMKKKIPCGRRLLYILAGIGIPFSIMLLSIAGGGSPPARAMYALPFAFAFMLFYLISISKQKIAAIIICMALFTSVRQVEITAQLLYSDYMRYQNDVQLARELDKIITPLQDNDAKVPVVLVGKYYAASQFKANYLQGEVPGHSVFEWDNKIEATNKRGFAFMDTLGIHYDRPGEAQMNQALREAESMPFYPAAGCVKRLPGFIVVKLSDSDVYTPLEGAQ